MKATEAPGNRIGGLPGAAASGCTTVRDSWHSLLVLVGVVDTEPEGETLRENEDKDNV